MSLKQNDVFWEHQQEIAEEENRKLDKGFECPDCGSEDVDEEDELCPECQGTRDEMYFDMYRDLERDCGYPEKFKN